MNVSASECNSGSESGWTSYLDQSSCSVTRYQRDSGVVDNDCRRKGTKQDGDEEEEEEDLSMVSDASSGPPHYEDEDCFGEDGYSYSTSTSSRSAKKNEKKIKKHGSSKQQHPYIDDTASSPVFNKKSLALSDDRVSMQHVLRQGFSGTQLKGKSAFQKHFGLFQSISEKPTSKEPGKF